MGKQSSTPLRIFGGLALVTSLLAVGAIDCGARDVLDEPGNVGTPDAGIVDAAKDVAIEVSMDAMNCLDTGTSSINAIPPKFKPTVESITFSFILPVSDKVTLSVFNVKSELVINLLQNQPEPACVLQSFEWDGMVGSGNYLPSGKYYGFLFTAAPYFSNNSTTFTVE